MRLQTYFISGVVILGLAAAGWCEFAVTELKGLGANKEIHGTARFEEVPEGLKIDVVMTGAPPGQHGLHIHEYSSCLDTAASGQDYNPEGLLHGNLQESSAKHVHAGDLGNISINADGKGELFGTFYGLTLSTGKYPVAGRSLLLFSHGDDSSQPDGNVGAPVACGDIILSGAGYGYKH